MAYSITVDLSSKRLTLYKNGSAIKLYPVGIGKIPLNTYLVLRYRGKRLLYFL